MGCKVMGQDSPPPHPFWGSVGEQRRAQFGGRQTLGTCHGHRVPLCASAQTSRLGPSHPPAVFPLNRPPLTPTFRSARRTSSAGPWAARTRWNRCCRSWKVCLRSCRRDALQRDWGGGGGSDVLERPYTVGRREGTPPPLIPFQCLRLTAKILLRRLRCQEDLNFKNVGPPSAGTIGGPPPPLQTPPSIHESICAPSCSFPSCKSSLRPEGEVPKPPLIGPSQPDMPLASGRETDSQSRSAPYHRPLSNTRPLHHQNSVGMCRVQRVAQ